MGTRADFYVGRGLEAAWLGSIAWDGNPGGIDDAVLKAADEATYRTAAEAFIKARDDGTTPDMGWPWPWDDSQTTDYAYAFDDGKVYGSCFGHEWFDPLAKEPPEHSDAKTAVFPNMKDVANVTYGKRSGFLIFGL